jgi:hypothetical protein
VGDAPLSEGSRQCVLLVVGLGDLLGGQGAALVGHLRLRAVVGVVCSGDPVGGEADDRERDRRAGGDQPGPAPQRGTPIGGGLGRVLGCGVVFHGRQRAETVVKV